MVNVSIGLAYLHYSLKRQAENRQYLIIQAMTFLRKYYDHRLRESSSPVQRQEAHYNLGRSYHQLGLTHLALKYYKLVLQEMAANGGGSSEENGDLDGRRKMENLAQEAAFNIQNCCLIGGDMMAARAMAGRHLTL